jgi:hypothetical protein
MIEVLSQAEADALLAMEKLPIHNNLIDLPDLGGTIEIQLRSQNTREEFNVNYRRGAISLSKRNHHMRARQVIGLARLDLDGPPHRNPDGQEIGSRHLHLYREGFDLKWAFEIPSIKFPNLDDAYQTLEDFLRYCNMVQLPNFRRSLFT